MFGIDFGLVLAQPFFLCSLILFAAGWFISFIATCVIGNAPMLWVDVFYNLFLLLGATLAVATNAVHNYRFVLLTFIAGSLTLLFSCIDVTINISVFSASKFSAAAAGFIFQSFALIFWVVYFGAEEESMAKQTINGFTLPRGNNSGNDNTTVGPTTTIVSPQPQHHQINMNGNGNGYQGSPIPAQQQAGQNNYSSVVVAPAADYAYKARALYSYEANPEDNNELSFTKGEILEIVDNKGKWWQARKPDGTVGIAPSNYLQLI